MIEYPMILFWEEETTIECPMVLLFSEEEITIEFTTGLLF